MKLIDVRGSNGQRRLYEIGDGRLFVEITECESHKGAGSLMELWVKNGYLPEFMDTYLSVDCTYVIDQYDKRNWYNPQLTDNGERLVINFDWILEANPENEWKLLSECERMMRLDIKRS